MTAIKWNFSFQSWLSQWSPIYLVLPFKLQRLAKTHGQQKHDRNLSPIRAADWVVKDTSQVCFQPAIMMTLIVSRSKGGGDR